LPGFGLGCTRIARRVCRVLVDLGVGHTASAFGFASSPAFGLRLACVLRLTFCVWRRSHCVCVKAEVAREATSCPLRPPPRPPRSPKWLSPSVLRCWGFSCLRVYAGENKRGPVGGEQSLQAPSLRVRSSMIVSWLHRSGWERRRGLACAGGWHAPSADFTWPMQHRACMHAHPLPVI
jgi:hypothetical protein